MWPVPGRKLQVDQAADPEAVNEALRDFHGMAGKVGEHNVDASTSGDFDREVNFDDDIAWRIRTGGSSSTFVDVAELADTAGTADDDCFLAIYLQNQWVPIFEETFTSNEQGALKCLANVQFGMPGVLPVTVGDVTFPVTAACAYVQLAWRIDGVVHMDYALGGADKGTEGANMEQGMGGYMNAADVEATVDIAPGFHRVELCAYMQGMLDVFDDDRTPVIFIYHHEWVLREMVR